MEKVTVVYDRVGNTLDVWFVRPRKAICEEIGKGFILKKDEHGNILGFEKINFTKTKKPLANLPVKVVVG